MRKFYVESGTGRIVPFGFTLIELLVVLAIIGILCSMVLSVSYGTKKQPRKQEQNCQQYERKSIRFVPKECYDYFRELAP